ncbi:hypothetical protein GCM10008018_64530 [Paenibacillus marchantiophytorum]|uniref:Uncharacterized protein n=1 Tax=Paenibacillus marchantiophytorum TaxID=1619310 RepID=A0ABQ1FFC1_9BACL|nr:hypothetical protein GCM10008018_64530 [Paenibacillus marchantiophytorum]
MAGLGWAGLGWAWLGLAGLGRAGLGLGIVHVTRSRERPPSPVDLKENLACSQATQSMNLKANPSLLANSIPFIRSKSLILKIL